MSVGVIDTLWRNFGHASFRPGQETVVRAVVDGRDVLAVMPNRSSKSRGYQGAKPLGWTYAA
jgi:ATP-dependent DNA helicase RecQ